MKPSSQESAAPKVRQFLGVCVDGLPFVAIALALTALVDYFGNPFWAAPLFVISMWVVWFFRDPERATPQDADAVISPADGKIIDIRQVTYPRLLSGEAIRISIFMNVFNVHVNRVPFSGVVRDVHYNPGKFLVASKEKASLDNEQTAVVLETPRGAILFVQIAGLVARRIVCRLKPGERVVKGERFGLIRFGSRCDVYLPAGSEITAKLGECSKAGETILGRLKA